MLVLAVGKITTFFQYASHRLYASFVYNRRTTHAYGNSWDISTTALLGCAYFKKHTSAFEHPTPTPYTNCSVPIALHEGTKATKNGWQIPASRYIPGPGIYTWYLILYFSWRGFTPENLYVATGCKCKTGCTNKRCAQTNDANVSNRNEGRCGPGVNCMNTPSNHLDYVETDGEEDGEKTVRKMKKQWWRNKRNYEPCVWAIQTMTSYRQWHTDNNDIQTMIKHCPAHWVCYAPCVVPVHYHTTALSYYRLVGCSFKSFKSKSFKSHGA